MSNTVITNYTDLNGPSTKADNSVVVIVNKDGSLSVEQHLLGTLMGSDSSQAAGISVVRVGHEGRPDDATDSETEDDKIPHVTLSVDSYYGEPNSIIKYDSGAEMLQSLRIETRENSLLGFQNDHCYTPLTSPNRDPPLQNDSYVGFDEPVIEIVHTPPPKPIPSTKKITILQQQIIPKGKKIVINPSESSAVLKGNVVLKKSVPTGKTKKIDSNKSLSKTEDNTESSSLSSEGDSIPDRDSDSDYKDATDKESIKVKRGKSKPRILKSTRPIPKVSKLDQKVTSRLKANRNNIKKELKEKISNKNVAADKKASEPVASKDGTADANITGTSAGVVDTSKNTPKQTVKQTKKEKKTPAHVTALLTDMTSLFSTPDVIRRVSTDSKAPSKTEFNNKKVLDPSHSIEPSDEKLEMDNSKVVINPKTYVKSKEKGAVNVNEKNIKGYDLIPQLDDASLAQIFQDPPVITTNKNAPTVTSGNALNSPGLAGALSPTLDLLGGLQPEEEGLTEDLLMHVAQLVESSENLQEVIDKQVLGKVDISSKNQVQSQQFQQPHTLEQDNGQTVNKVKTITTRKDPIEIIRRDGRVITLPPIEAPATRSSKRKSQVEPSVTPEVHTPSPSSLLLPISTTPEPQVQHVSKQYINKKLANKKQEPEELLPDKMFAESQESWNSEDDPYRLWCICKQPHNNRFMICCDSCEDWFHGKCVNITKAMGQQMEEQGVEWRCPNCIKKVKTCSRTSNKISITQKKQELEEKSTLSQPSPVIVKTHLTSGQKTLCIVCKKSARNSSIYCSDACILKHAQDSLDTPPNKTDMEGKEHEKQKSESRVIVYERKSGRLLAGPNAPTAENLKAWLQKNPTFEVVRPGTLSTIKPNVIRKRTLNDNANKIQTTLNFERIPRKPGPVHPSKQLSLENKESVNKVTPSKDIKSSPQSVKAINQPKTPATPKFHIPPEFPETPKASTSSAKPIIEPRKLARMSSRSQSTHEKTTAVAVATSPLRRKEAPDHKHKMNNSTEPVRDNVRKALQEQMGMRMAENTALKFTEQQIKQFANDTEAELYELFKDVGMKYKAKYRSLMFNIKDRKNLSLWHKICDQTITPKQLVRLSPEELASQELAEWRDQEAKHQLELIKKNEIDLLAASKTYVLKTHKGEEVMETKAAVSTELDPTVPVEELVTVLNDATVSAEEPCNENLQDSFHNGKSSSSADKKPDRKKTKEDSYSKKSSRQSKRDIDNRKPRTSRRKSEMKEKKDKSTHRSDKRSRRARSYSRDRSKVELTKEKYDSNEQRSRRSRSKSKIRSRSKSKKRSKSQARSRSTSQGHEPSPSSGRTKRRSRSREVVRRRTRSKHSSSTEDKYKNRSRSQEISVMKEKSVSPGSESIERPKSAMLKEVHPQYDPHEPMITSAFSEEDIRKSREDVYEDSYKNDITEFHEEYDPTKGFSIDTSTVLPTLLHDKTTEAESDQEPSSTVDNSAPIVWNGCINMVDVARFYVAALQISGNAADIEDDLSPELDIVGRINPDTVWDYIGKMKRASNKDIIILKLQAANDEEKMQYIALYSYLSTRNRLGVVKVNNTTLVKDLYIVPLSANTCVPAVLAPLEGLGLGLGDSRTHLLIAIVIRQRKKRTAAAASSHAPKIIPTKVSRKRSYTPPVLPAPPAVSSLTLPGYSSPALSNSVKDQIAASLASAADDEPYSPGSSNSSGSVSTAVTAPSSFTALTATSSSTAIASSILRSKMEELNRQIEEQKQQIRKMTQVETSVEQDEAYSPSRPMTPPAAAPAVMPALENVSLPYNLHEILASIKHLETTSSGDVDMRSMSSQ